MTKTNTKQTGATKTVDELGRIMLPSRLREAQGILPGDKFEFVTNGTVIMMLRHAPNCLACKMNETEVARFGDTFLCEVCREAIEATLR